MVQPEYQRWITKLLGYNFEIRYKPGLENKATNALSRLPPPLQLTHISASTVIDIDVIKAEVEVDPQWTAIFRELKSDPDSVPRYTLQHGILRYKNWLVVSKTSSLIPAILHMFNDSVLGGHSGFLRTYKWLIGELY